MAEIYFSHLSLSERGIEIGYNEDRDRGEHAMLFRTIFVERDLVEQEIADLSEMVQEIVDKGLEAILNPPPSIPARKRMEL